MRVLADFDFDLLVAIWLSLDQRQHHVLPLTTAPPIGGRGERRTLKGARYYVAGSIVARSLVVSGKCHPHTLRTAPEVEQILSNLVALFWERRASCYGAREAGRDFVAKTRSEGPQSAGVDPA